jgi:hypothetical protein
MTIHTSAQWWRLIEHNWDDLALLLRRSGLAHDLAAIERLMARRDARIAGRLMAAKRCAPDRRGPPAKSQLADPVRPVRRAVGALPAGGVTPPPFSSGPR